MDPVTAFSLACGVIQVLDAAVRLSVSAFDAATSSSGLDKNNRAILTDLQKLKQSLHDLRQSDVDPKNQSLDNATETSDGRLDSMVQPVTPGVRNAIESASQHVDRLSSDLIELLEKHQTDPSLSKRRRFIQALFSTSSQSKIKSLRDELNVLETRLERTLIVDIRSIAQQLMSSNSSRFGELSQSAQAIAFQITNLETTIAKILSSNERIEQALVTLRTDTSKNAGRSAKGFQELVNFHGMYQRQHNIPDAAPTTYEWIFKTDPVRWDDFGKWLQGEGPIYWITGKPGAGKSTLMCYLWDRRLSSIKANLDYWACPHVLLTASCFFWNPGSDLQKSSRGMLRTLLSQLLEQCPSIDESFARYVSVLEHDKDASGILSEQTLLNIFCQALAREDLRFFFLIDGLDEYGDAMTRDHLRLLSILKSLIHSSSGRLKILASSRNLKVFEQSLTQRPKLRLHLLTYDDMLVYTSTNLSGSPIPDLASMLVQKAQGVFVWLKLAIESLNAAIVGEASDVELLQEFDRLPEELHDLYAFILKKIEPNHISDAQVYLSLAYHASKSSSRSAIFSVLSALALPDHGLQNLTPWDTSPEAAFRLFVLTGKAILRITARTRGLLEFGRVMNIDSSARPEWRAWFHQLQHFPTDPDRTEFNSGTSAWYFEAGVASLSSLQIEFFHRSVIEFLESSPLVGQRWTKPPFEALAAGIQAFLYTQCTRSYLNYSSKPPSVVQGFCTIADEYPDRLVELVDLIVKTNETAAQHHGCETVYCGLAWLPALMQSSTTLRQVLGCLATLRDSVYIQRFLDICLCFILLETNLYPERAGSVPNIRLEMLELLFKQGSVVRPQAQIKMCETCSLRFDAWELFGEVASAFHREKHGQVSDFQSRLMRLMLDNTHHLGNAKIDLKIQNFSYDIDIQSREMEVPAVIEDRENYIGFPYQASLATNRFTLFRLLGPAEQEFSQVQPSASALEFSFSLLWAWQPSSGGHYPHQQYRNGVFPQGFTIIDPTALSTFLDILIRDPFKNLSIRNSFWDFLSIALNGPSGSFDPIDRSSVAMMYGPLWDASKETSVNPLVERRDMVVPDDEWWFLSTALQSSVDHP